MSVLRLDTNLINDLSNIIRRRRKKAINVKKQKNHLHWDNNYGEISIFKYKRATCLTPSNIVGIAQTIKFYSHHS